MNIKVLVVDDSALIRRFIAQAIEGEPGIEVVGSANDGKDALAKIKQLKPDVVTLDIEMPVMSGLQILPELTRRYPRMAVIMFSTLTADGAEATLDALALGASDFVTKPSGPGGVAHSSQRIREELIPRIKALAEKPAVRREASPPRRELPLARVDCVVIGVSTGGPSALNDLVPRLPADLAVPVVIVQHMPTIFTKFLAERLDDHSAIRVVEAIAGTDVVAGTAFVAPGGTHLTLERIGDSIRTAQSDSPPKHSCRPSACVTFRSALETYGAGVLAVLMTGMGDDGSDAAVEIHAAGGRVIAQDEATSVVWGMPRAAVRAGVVDEEFPLPDLASEIVRRVAVGRSSGPAGRYRQV